MKRSIEKFAKVRSRIIKENFSLAKLREQGTMPSRVFSRGIPEYGVMIAYDLPDNGLGRLDWFAKGLKRSIPSVMIYDETNAHMNNMACRVSSDVPFTSKELTELVIFLSEAVYRALPLVRPFTSRFDSWLINQSSVISTGRIAAPYVLNQVHISQELDRLKPDISNRLKQYRFNGLEGNAENSYNPLEHIQFKNNPLQHVVAARFTQRHSFGHLSNSGLLDCIDRDSPIGSAEFNYLRVGTFKLDSTGFSFMPLEFFDLEKPMHTTYVSYRQ